MYSQNHLSFQETKDEMAAKLFALDQKRRKGIITINEVGDYFPVGVLINSNKGENLYMKKNFNRFAALTKREKEILSLVATEKESKCIAEELYISRHTVEQHRKNITKKVEHRNFAELIRFAIAFDLV